MDRTPVARTVAGLVTLAALIALVALSLWTVAPPPPAGTAAPADAFSAARAFAHVQRMSQRVHVAGSPAADEVRRYAEATMRGYGLRVSVQDTVGASDELGHGYAMARVRNVVAVLPGTDPTGTVFAVAHYDSVQVSHGANDDGAGVSTLLEAARALTTGPAPRNDIVFVLTDAEEACLCGAEAFVSQHPLAARGGVALNFEARGSGGPAIMFETGAGNAGVVGVYGASVPYPVATSFAVEVYRILPNDTDFTPFREAGRFTGLNTAYIDGSAVYHSPEDRPEYMSRASLQHHGDNGLALLRAFGGADLAPLARPSAYDSTYFPVLGQLVRYPGTLVWPVAVLALLAVAGLTALARRRGVATVGRTLAGLGLAVLPLVAAAVLAQALWALLVAVRPGYREMLDPWRPGWYRLAVVALVAAAILTWYGLLRRRIGAWPLAIGGLGLLAVLGLVLAAATPGGSYLAAVPALAGAIAGAVSLSVRPAWAVELARGLGAGVAVVVLAPTVLLFFPALGLATGAAAALFAALLGLALLPALEALYPAAAGPRRRLWGAAPAFASGVLAVVFVVTGLAVDRFDPAHPAPEQLMYALDTDTGQARWVSGDSEPGAWTGSYVSGREDLAAQFPPLGGDRLLTGPAPAAALPAPAVTTVSDMTTAGRRTLTLTITPQRAVRLVYLGVEDATVVSASVAGRDVAAGALGTDFGVLFHAPPAEGLRVTLVLDAPGPVRLRVMDGSDGLDGLPGFTPRPPDVGVAGSHDSELVLVAKAYTL
ncbi:M20/M25/M40 family metallo-hydrolase [Luedemannella helvata]|uniref:Vacuolar membrane protease n=1 Tax=Luedemannella helvata TaxID=349315 RepID=A0ABP4VZ29_9ACTN